MTGRLRYVLAAAFVALYLLIPAPDDDPGRQYLAELKTRSWLMGDDTPFQAAVQDGRLPPLQATVAPPSQDAVLQSDRQARYERSTQEWVRGQQAAREDIELDPSLPAIVLQVLVGDDGFRSTLGRQTGEVIAEPLEEGYPGRTSLLPAFLAIVLAILSGKIIPSLLVGALAGTYAFVARGDAGIFGVAWGGLERFAGNTLPGVLTDSFYLEVLGFILFLFMAVGVMARSGGIQGMVTWVSGFAKGPVSSQLCAWIIGILIFFDDYTNCIITGTTMRPITDRNRVSREKLSYIVDSTAAPIAGVAIVSTWVAYEVSQFANQLPEVTKADGTPYQATEGFAVKVATLPFRYYCLFTLIMVFLTIVMRRDWGPMLSAERRARTENKPIADGALPMVSKELSDLEAPEGAPQRGINAFLPVALMIGITVVLIYTIGAYEDGAYVVPESITGWLDRSLWILGESQSQYALMWGAVGGLVLAVILAISQRILSVQETVLSAIRSVKALIFAAVILILAWCLAATCSDLDTAYYLTAAFQDAFDPRFLPVLLFALSGLIAFSTGTSYGTMAILLPNVVVLSHTMGETIPELGGPALMIVTIGSVLEGSIFGDHCSPISDTTVLSSVGTASDHLHHVQTQAPYAVLTMAIAMVCGYVPIVLLGTAWWPLTWALGIAAMVGFLFVVGRRPEPDAAAAAIP